ncbi:MAG: nitronate monooxygenase [Granulosicoccaceae bacterium]
MLKNNRFLELVGTTLPIIQSPMAGAQNHRLAIAVSKAGGLGSLPCAMLSVDDIESELSKYRQESNGPINLNFFCHTPAPTDTSKELAWKQSLAEFYTEHGIDIDTPINAQVRNPFNEVMCQLVEAFKPEVVSFHFGLPEKQLLARVKAAGCIVIASATTVEEAVWLEANGCDAIIAQGVEAGGHRGMFLSDDITTQPGLFALLPQVADAVSLPIIAAGAIADGRGIAAAFTLGANAVQMGTAYLLTNESLVSNLHREAIRNGSDSKTALTNVFSGKPARSLCNRVMDECGPISDDAPAFPNAGAALTPLKTAAEKTGSADFSSLWSGQAAKFSQAVDAETLTKQLFENALQHTTNC